MIDDPKGPPREEESLIDKNLPCAKKGWDLGENISPASTEHLALLRASLVPSYDPEARRSYLELLIGIIKGFSLGADILLALLATV